jgi:hypothetical protein
MLSTIGQGVTLDAIVKLGYKNTHDDFDICRFFKRDDGGHELALDVTWALVNSEPATKAVSTDTEFPALLSELWTALANVGFTVDEEFRRATGRVRFARFDRLVRMGEPRVTAVHVYAQYGCCIGPTSV